MVNYGISGTSAGVMDWSIKCWGISLDCWNICTGVVESSEKAAEIVKLYIQVLEDPLGLLE